jgi:hypothetical protein
MTTLKYTSPTAGEINTVAEPKVDTALTELRTVVNGELEGGGVNLRAGTIAKTDLTAAVQAELASFVGLPLESKKSIIATEQEREAVTYGVLSTPDEVEVVMATNGLIAVAYQATWKSSATLKGRAAIFVGANQMSLAPATTGGAEVQAARAGSGTEWTPLATCGFGLASNGIANPYSGDATTGQAVGMSGNVLYELGTTALESNAGTYPAFGGPVYIFAAAGTYKISVRFKSATGKVTVKNRKLWAWIVG